MASFLQSLKALVVSENQLTPYFYAIVHPNEPIDQPKNEFNDYPSRISKTSLRYTEDTSHIEVSNSKGLCTAFQIVDLSFVSLILEFLEPEDLCVLACLSKSWNDEASHNSYWKKLFIRDFGKSAIPKNFELTPGSMKKLYRDCSPHVGDVLEVIDTVCKWVIARVILVLNRSLFLVYFEGWSESYIMWVDKRRDSPRIRPLHPQFFTGIGQTGPIPRDQFEKLVEGCRRCILKGEVTWPIPPCSYLPCIYYEQTMNPPLRSCYLKTTIHDKERVLRLQKTRESELGNGSQIQFVSTKELQQQPPPLWVTLYPQANQEFYYSPESFVEHNYRRDPYPNEISLTYNNVIH